MSDFELGRGPISKKVGKIARKGVRYNPSGLWSDPGGVAMTHPLTARPRII